MPATLRIRGVRGRLLRTVPRKAVVLLSGGLDSATTLYWALDRGYEVHCLIFDYGQRHRREINQAKNISGKANCKYRVVKIELPWKGSSLLDGKAPIPKNRPLSEILHFVQDRPALSRAKGEMAGTIPSTYVPARNAIFLSMATSFAEAIGADSIFIGAHRFDSSGYPDCRPEFYQAFSEVIKKGTKAGAEKKKISVKTPLINKTKAQIIKMGSRLGVPFQLTWSCYEGGKSPCGRCDSCKLRARGFKEVGVEDPLLGTRK